MHTSLEGRQKHGFETFGDAGVRVNDGLQQISPVFFLADFCQCGTDFATVTANFVTATAGCRAAAEEQLPAATGITPFETVLPTLEDTGPRCLTLTEFSRQFVQRGRLALLGRR